MIGGLGLNISRERKGPQILTPNELGEVGSQKETPPSIEIEGGQVAPDTIGGRRTHEDPQNRAKLLVEEAQRGERHRQTIEEARNVERGGGEKKI